MGRKPGQLLEPLRRPRAAVTGLSRRRWLHAVLGLVGSLALPAARSAPSSLESPSASFDADAFALLGGRAALVRQGALYLAAHPDERDPHRLRRLLVPEPGLPARQALLAAVARDWRAHDVLTLDGWVLARSEARICALACLGATA